MLVGKPPELRRSALELLARGNRLGQVARDFRIGESCRYPPLIVDEVGYSPCEPEAVNLLLQLVFSRYKHASSILTSNLPIARWGDVFGDHAVASAIIDRIVHRAEVFVLNGNSCRLKDTKLTLTRL